MNGLKKIFPQKELFLILLPVFFVFHGFTENYFLVPVKDAALLTGLYITAGLLLAMLFYLVLRSRRKAALFSFYLLCFHFFFGSLHDNSKAFLGTGFITSYSFILPASLVLFIALLLYLRKTRRTFTQLVRFLNLVLFLFIVLDLAWLTFKIISKEDSNRYFPAELTAPAKKQDWPDVYLIVADEYAGSLSLKKNFNFDNSYFQDSLKKLGFHLVLAPRSNYYFTPFSIASLLNYNYLPIKDTNHTLGEVPTIMQMIKNNSVTHFFSGLGYKIYNNSYFDLATEPTTTEISFLPSKTTYITAQTFLSRAQRDIAFNLVTRFKVEWIIKSMTYYHLRSNNDLIAKTMATIKDSEGPKFSYTHLMMPHYPYYFNKDGKPYSFETVAGLDYDKARYISYLQYSNKTFLNIISSILHNSKKPPIVIFMSDHGFRGEVEINDYFNNFVAVYTPDQAYHAFHDNISNVNVFRALLNTQFQQKLPMLQDKSIQLKD
jgi:hypothetical protein